MRVIPKQGEQVELYLVYGDGILEEVFTNKDQAEAGIRHLADVYRDVLSWRIREMTTQPHSNTGSAA